ncbi:Condensin-2 complex subunit D3 [Gryllus bimaculatus]|nr:Condensin-2 complex subunit D3 [Gryllus bimaculatus]
MDIVNCFSHLQLRLLGEEWVQQVWDSDFAEFDELPNEYEEFVMENDVVNALEMIVKLLRVSVGRNDEFLDSAGPSEDSITVSWELLVENKVEHRHLISLLGYFIANGQDKPEDMKAMELCFKSCSLYFLLLTIPGCDAFFVFQPSIYEKGLKTLNVCSKLNETKPSKPPRGRKKTNNEDDDEAGEGDEEGNDVSFLSLTVQAKMNIRKNLNVILKDMSLMMKKYPLKTEDTLEKTLTQLISHTRLVSNVQTFDFDTFKINGDISSIVSNSYNLLKALCSPLHGKTEGTVKLILYHLLPNILMAGDFVRDITMGNLNLIRLQTEKFVLHLLKSLVEESYQGICLFVQHLCARVTDRADFRLKVSQSIVSLLKALPSEPYFNTIKWVLRFAHDVKASHRLFAVEVISKLLYEEERPNDIPGRDSLTPHRVSPEREEDNEDVAEELDPVMNNSQQQERDVASHKYLLGVLFSRCHDQSGTVRTKALSTLTDCLQSNNKLIVELMKEIFVIPYEDNDLIQNDSIVERGFLNTKIFLDSLDKPQHLQADPLPGGKAVVKEMLKLVEDDKVFVRKSAFSFLENVIKLNRKWLTDKLLKVMCDHVRDPALLIKKQLIQSLTDLVLKYPDDAHLAKYYIEAVLPQISHPEVKVQEKVLESLENTILHKLVPFKNLGSEASYLPWKLFEVIIDLKKKKFFQIVCSLWAKDKTFPKNLISLIQTHIETQHNVAAWLFLSCVAPYIPLKDPNFVVDYYRENLTNSEKTTRYAVVKALDVLGTAWKYLPKGQQDSICTELLLSVEHMRLSTTLIGPVLDVVLLITLGQASSVKEGQESVMVWSKRILEKTEEYFQQHSPCRNDNTRVNMEEFMRNLVTLGDVSQLCPGKVPINVAIILTGILFPEKLHDPVKWSVPGLQALTVVTLGKMCLQNETLAKRIIPALGLLLAESKHEAVKVNVIYTLSDMCIRFTAIVEPLLPEMCVCLKDSNDIVRHHTVTVFVRLLQQDFLKLRGALLFHMMSMLVDPMQNIAQLANYFMTQCVVTRNKSIMYQNIVESIFYYNKYENHPVYSKVKLSAQEAHLFNLAGAENEAKRQTLYRFMCEHMSDEHRMQAVHKICVDILGGVSNETVSLDEKGESVLHDAFFVLSCEEICLHSLRTQSEEEPATDDAERVTAAVNTAKKNIISQCVKKQVVEIIIPIIVQLKGKLQAIMSPLLTNLMSYLRGLLKDYKNEIEEIFAEDKTMAEEILFDMKRFEEEEKNRAQSQDSDEEDGGEVDHMRPLLVELATNHLRKSIRHGDPQNSTQTQGTGSPGTNDPASTMVSDGKSSTNNSPSETKESSESPQTESNSQLVESPPENEHPSGRTRRCSTTRSNVDSIRSRSCTPTKRSASRNLQNHSHGEPNDASPVGEASSTPVSSPNKSVTGSETSRRQSSRQMSTDSNLETPASENNARARSRTPNRQNATRDSQKRSFDEALLNCDTSFRNSDTPTTSSRSRTTSGSESSRRRSCRSMSTDSNPESSSTLTHVKTEQVNGTDAVNGESRKPKQRNKRIASRRTTGESSP